MNELSDVSSIEAYLCEEEGLTLRRTVLELSPPQPTEVLVDVVACGVCHTDLHVMKGEVAFPRPAVLGHEISGVVREVGRNITHVKPGDRVVCSFIMPCASCRHCESGLPELCEEFFRHNRLNGRLLDGTTRIHAEDGASVAMYSMAGHATRAVVPGSAVFLLPTTVSITEAAILGCSMMTAYGAVHEVGHVQPGETVAVIAAGGVGLSMVQLAKAAGASEIVVIDIDAQKLALAKELGATLVLNSTEVNAHDAVLEHLGHGVDIAFEALGAVQTVRLAVDLVDDGGRVVLAGIAPAGQTIDAEITRVVRRKIKILGSFGANPKRVMPQVIDLAASGGIDLSALITDRYGFDDVESAYTHLAQGRIRGRAIVTVGPEDADDRTV